MSGGSYDYLGLKDLDQVCCMEGQLRSMHAKLMSLGAEDAAAAETMMLINAINGSHALIDKLQGVWKSVEWMDSGDWGMENVQSALSAYRRTNPENNSTTSKQ